MFDETETAWKQKKEKKENKLKKKKNLHYYMAFKKNFFWVFPL